MVLLKMWTHPLLTLLRSKAGSKFIKYSSKLKVTEMFCITMSLPKKADARNISQMWVKISRWIERAGESGRCRLPTKSHWQSAWNSICPGCVRKETWGWVPVATIKCLAKIHFAALSRVSLHLVLLMFPKGPVLLLYGKTPTLQISALSLCTKTNCGVWLVTAQTTRLPAHPLNYQCTTET